MKRLVLLILDGDGFRSPGLTMEMDAQGWDLVWVDSARVAPAQDENIMPDLALFDPSTAGLEAVPALQLLRLRNPLLPLAALDSDHAANILRGLKGPKRESLLTLLPLSILAVWRRSAPP